MHLYGHDDMVPKICIGPNTRIIIPGIPLDERIDDTPTGSTTKWTHPGDEIAARNLKRQLSIIREKMALVHLVKIRFLIKV